MIVSPPPLNVSLIDPHDLPSVEVAHYLNVPIIVGNMKHFENIEEIEVFSPQEFLEICVGYKLWER